MTKEEILQKTTEILNNLPKESVKHINSYEDFILLQYEEYILQKGIEKLASESGSFDFLNEEPDLYTLDDLKERYR